MNKETDSSSANEQDGNSEHTDVSGDAPAEKVQAEAAVEIEVRDTLESIEASQWNALNDDGNPFLRYEFLFGLEKTECLGEHNGWYPRYFFLWENGTVGKSLLAGVATYVKTNSYGEFVFDWAWAEAYQRHNLDYYPKLVASVPFTPATGRRLLVRADQDYKKTALLLSNGVQQFCQSQQFSSMHWLFITEQETDLLSPLNTSPNSNYLRRIDCQYHWKNANYESFDAFLAQCTAKRRKTIRRERRYVTDAQITLTNRLGNTLSEEEWAWVHKLYQSTFDRKWGNPSLTLAFFKRMGETFGNNILIVFAYNPFTESPDIPVACSIMFIGTKTLYGRFWGCREEHHCLHFEACYYQGIEYCIEHGIQTFEPGAQGEHKITRGFEPTITRSAHYIAHPQFRQAIGDFLAEETPHIEQRCKGLSNLLPFRSDVEI